MMKKQNKLEELLKDRMFSLNYKINKETLYDILLDNDVTDKDEQNKLVKSILLEQMMENFSDKFMKFVKKNDDGDEVRYTARMIVLSYQELLEIMKETASQSDNQRQSLIKNIDKTLKKGNK